MKLCAHNHVAVCHEGDTCPLCLEMAKAERLSREVGALEHRLASQQKPQIKDLLATRDICELLGCTRRTVVRYREMGWLPRKNLTPRAEVMAALPKINEFRRRTVPMQEAA